MDSNIVILPADMPIEQVARTLGKDDMSDFIIVVENERIFGVVSYESWVHPPTGGKKPRLLRDVAITNTVLTRENNILEDVLRRIGRHEAELALVVRDEELAGHRAWLAERLSRLEPQMGFIRAMRAALPEDGIFVDEVTQLGFASRLAFPVHAPRTFLSPGYQDNLGWGYGTALGVKAALPERPVLAIAGDGGFMYQVGELATAAQHGIAAVVVVFDNGMFGNVHGIQKEQYGGRFIADELKNPDFVKLAESFGIAAFRARDGAELETALKAAFALDEPALVHVPCGEMPSPWDMILMPRVRG